MSDKLRSHSRVNRGNSLEFFDQSTFERLLVLGTVNYDDDFLGARATAFPTTPTQGIDWVAKKQQTGGTPTVAGVAGSGGIVQCAIDATSEKQEATLYWGDNKHLDVTKGLVWEARIKLSVLPSAAGVQAVWGIAASWIDGPDNNTQYLEFGATANGTILMRSQDGTTQKSISSGLTVVNTDWHIFRVDANDVTDVQFFIDGVQFNTNGQFPFAATDNSALLQAYMSVYKPSGTGVATLQADYFAAFQNQRA
jgi:hypothetical protein